MDKKTQFYDLLAYIAAAAKEKLDQVFIQETRQMILDNRSLLLNDREQFGLFLDQLTMKIAAKIFS